MLVDEFNLVTFDYTGYGYSDKDKCTLGPRESYDLESVMNYVREVYGFKRVYVWGRSMGAVAAALMCQRCQNGACQGMVLDSPYSSTKEMLCNVMEKVPNFLLYMLFMPLGSKLKRETGYDMMETSLNDVVPSLTVPALFSVAEGDTLAGVKNVENLYTEYGKSTGQNSKKHLVRFPGDHSSTRDESFIKEGRGFFEALENQHRIYDGPLSPTAGKFSGHHYIKALHGLNSPRRLKKSDIFIDIHTLRGTDDGINEFDCMDDKPGYLSSPLKVRGMPEVISKLGFVKGDSQGVLDTKTSHYRDESHMPAGTNISRYGPFNNARENVLPNRMSPKKISASNNVDMDIKAIFADSLKDNPIASQSKESNLHSQFGSPE
jgi:Serine aminopeptidase, S33